MSRLEVFEPAMCCPTGVCGIDVDPVLVQFNADLKALEASGVTVSRHSLSHDAAAFAAQPLAHDPQRPLDAAIEHALWLDPAELANHPRLRSPLVARCVADWQAGRHYPLSVLEVV